MSKTRAEYGSLDWFLMGIQVILGMDILIFIRTFFKAQKKKTVVATFFPPEIASTTPGYHPEEQSKAIEEVYREEKEQPGTIISGTLPRSQNVQPMEKGPEQEAQIAAYEQYAESRRQPYTSTSATVTPQTVVDKPAIPAPTVTPDPAPIPDSTPQTPPPSAYELYERRQINLE